MKVHDAEIESKEALKEAFLQKEPIKVGNIIYVPECFTLKKSGFVDACQFCRFYRVKGLCKSYFADKVCSACVDADLDVNFNDGHLDIVQRAHREIKFHYLQTQT